MILTRDELEYLSTWAREEWEPACYNLPAHRLQLAHRVQGAELIVLIKAWTASEKKKVRAILDAGSNPQPLWPWSTDEQFRARLSDAAREQGDVRQVRKSSAVKAV
jgi:hypothetical protein